MRPSYFVYLLKCLDGSLYCGITTDVKRRFKEHKDGKGGNYTRSHRAIKMMYTEKCKDRSMALKREIAIKRLARPQKIQLTHSICSGQVQNKLKK